ncbi:MAG: penicillin-insensitive murein endopeptidase [Rhodospirillales bacterium]|nr:penicillin-insensitive murein endopeptidase [Rhodospirillales bacterium]
MLIRIAIGFNALFLMIAAAGASSAEPQWWQVEKPLAERAQAFGSHARGCLAGAVALADDGAGFQVVRPSRNRFFGHPELIDFVRAFAREVERQGWAGLLVGDIAQPRGGPMRSGHASHQTGLDVDIWFRPAPERPLSRTERDALAAVSMVDSGGRAVDGGWSHREAALLRTAASDPRVARIFVNPAIKQRLCQSGSGDRGWLQKIRPWWGHDSHFHVRLHCPADDRTCVDQTPPPPGDGCGDDLAWWFSEDAQRMAAERKARTPADTPPITLAELPAGCAPILMQP